MLKSPISEGFRHVQKCQEADLNRRHEDFQSYLVPWYIRISGLDRKNSPNIPPIEKCLDIFGQGWTLLATLWALDEMSKDH